MLNGKIREYLNTWMCDGVIRVCPQNQVFVCMVSMLQCLNELLVATNKARIDEPCPALIG